MSKASTCSALICVSTLEVDLYKRSITCSFYNCMIFLSWVKWTVSRLKMNLMTFRSLIMEGENMTLNYLTLLRKNNKMNSCVLHDGILLLWRRSMKNNETLDIINKHFKLINGAGKTNNIWARRKKGFFSIEVRCIESKPWIQG